MLKVGLPGAKEGMDERDPTIAEYLKSKGYMTGQFGKNHLGDRDEHLPTNHGFDEFIGNLYHLNAEEGPSIRIIQKIQHQGEIQSQGVIKSKLTAALRTPGR